MSTGYITVTATGGSGQYNYKVTGPITTPYTSSNVITGLLPGNYTVTVKDLVGSCTKDQFNIVITGSYTDPRFSLVKTDETCMNSNNGTVTVTGLTGGRGPFMFTIIAPSPFGVGTSSVAGSFTNLPGGDYSIQMTDSCGGIQTRRVTVLDYNWWIDAVGGTRTNCDDVTFNINLKDSRGNVNTSGSFFTGFQYGWVRGVNDTVWFASRSFAAQIGTRRSISLVSKDGCGNVMSAPWAVNPKPIVGGSVSTSQQTCNSFSASIGGQANLTNPQYCLYTSADVLVNCNTTGNFTGITKGSYYININDVCYDTTIRRNFTLTQPVPYLPASVTTTRVTCSSFNAQVTGMLNFTSPNYCLFDASNVQIVCNATGIFNGLTNGSYKVEIQDGCYDTTIVRSFAVSALVPSVATNVTINNKTCSDFSVNIGGQTNLNSPQFCLFTSANVLLSCNTTGIFNNIPFGDYCMRITNSASCYDTTIQRCFSVNQNTPSVNSGLTIVRTCNSITLTVTGQNNLTNPQYCVYDNNNVQITCNTTGVFSNLPYGTYCVDVQNDAGCYDTIIRRCVTVIKNIPSIGNVNLSSTVCAGFSATVSSQAHLSSPVFSLKNGAGVVIAVNGTGVFTGLGYGSYCIEMQNDNTCYDTLITKCFSATRPVPSVGTVTVNGQTCTTFNADVTGEANLTTPVYYLVDAVGDTIATNLTGTFNSILFGTYDIHIRDNCYDTTIVRNITGSPIAVTTTITSQLSCTVNRANIRVQFNTGFGPYNVKVYNPGGILIADVNSAINPVFANDLPGLPVGSQYTVVATDNCGRSQTVMVTVTASTFLKALNLIPKCPSGINQNGSSDMAINVSSNLGVITPKIIKVNGVASVINYGNQTGTTYSWYDLAPGTYEVEYSLPGSCTNKYYETVTVAPYNFPALDNSAAYQCNNNNFSVGASVTGGSAPYTYQIIGSVPSGPSINTVPQASPVFSITNGITYSLVRLRAIDACGNATLNDVSILPLQNVLVNASSNCFYNDITLSVDTIANASYTWYKKTSPTDSIEVGTAQNFQINYLLPTDTGTYVSKVSVNSGCLTTLSYFSVTGMCTLLPVKEIKLTGKQSGSAAELKWAVKGETEVKEYVVERSNKQGSGFQAVGTVSAKSNGSDNYYQFMDSRPDAGSNYYRLKVVDKDSKFTYSNTIVLNWTGGKISLYPNPARDMVNINIVGRQAQDIRIQLFNLSGQLLQEKVQNNVLTATIPMYRQNIKTGLYLIKITDTRTGTVTTEKVMFQ